MQPAGRLASLPVTCAPHVIATLARLTCGCRGGQLENFAHLLLADRLSDGFKFTRECIKYALVLYFKRASCLPLQPSTASAGADSASATATADPSAIWPAI